MYPMINMLGLPLVLFAVLKSVCPSCPVRRCGLNLSPTRLSQWSSSTGTTVLYSKSSLSLTPTARRMTSGPRRRQRPLAPSKSKKAVCAWQFCIMAMFLTFVTNLSVGSGSAVLVYTEFCSTFQLFSQDWISADWGYRVSPGGG